MENSDYFYKIQSQKFKNLQKKTEDDETNEIIDFLQGQFIHKSGVKVHKRDIIQYKEKLYLKNDSASEKTKCCFLF
jgi:hypothetical protein